MAKMLAFIGVMALAISYQPAMALPEPRAQVTAAPVYKTHVSCFSYTTTAPSTEILFCPLLKPCGPVAECIVEQISTLEIPCPNPACPKTPTVTVTASPTCPTCQTGCATAHVTTTITDKPCTRVPY